MSSDVWVNVTLVIYYERCYQSVNNAASFDLVGVGPNCESQLERDVLRSCVTLRSICSS